MIMIIIIIIIIIIVIITIIITIDCVPARARCVWSKSGLARQSCSERLDRGGK